MLIGRDRLQPLLPHDGAMLLIDGVTAWDERQITCVTDRHRDDANPLRKDGRLSALHAVEFAAQAAAVHGGLMSEAGRAPLRALAALRQVRLARPRLDDLDTSLVIEATAVMLDAGAAIYQARLSGGETEIAAMRLTLMTFDLARVES